MSDDWKPEPALRVVLLAVGTLLVGAEASPVEGGPRAASPQAPASGLPVPGSASRGGSGVVRTASGYRVSTASLTAHLTAEGVRVAPHQGGSLWGWRLVAVESGGEPVAGIDAGSVPPVETAAGIIDYQRGALRERYVVKAGSVEQQFVIPAPLPLGGRDLVIAGEVATGGGRFAALADGWRWGRGPGAVRLGEAQARDAGGREVPVELSVTAEATRLVIDGTALATARYPVTIDPEIGADDFRISEMGTHGDPIYFASGPKVAYNSTRDEYLVVWFGNDDLSDGREIYVQRLDATGAEIGEDDLKITSMGDGEPALEANAPRVAYNPVDDEYLVVWWGDDVNNGEQEVHGQRLDAMGVEVGEDDFRISEMGPDGDTGWGVVSVSVAHNPVGNEYLVVWEGCDTVECEFEIYGQRLDGATGTEVGEDDFRISDVGPDGDDSFSARGPDVVYNETQNEYLVVWNADETPGVGNREIHGQRLEASTGAEVGENDFPISAGFGDADWAAAAHNPDEDEYLVVWEGLGGVIWGQRLDGATGAEVGEDDFQVSDIGEVPRVVYNPQDGEYLVVWQGAASGDTEVHGQRLDGATGAEVGLNDFRLSRVGPDGNPAHNAASPDVAYDPLTEEYLVVFSADPVVSFCREIYGQRYTPGLFEDDFEDGEIAGWWAFPRGTWSEEEGILVGEAVGGGAEPAALAVAAGFEGCERCRVTTELEVSAAESPAGPVAATLVGWFEAPGDQVLVSLETDTDTVRLVERENGTVVAEASAVASLEPDVLYEVAVSFDGELFRVGLDRVVVIEMPSGATDLPSGRFALAVRNADLAVETFHVVGPDGG